jgi:LysM repeat protein
MKIGAPKTFVLLVIVVILVAAGAVGCTRAKSSGVIPSSVEGTPQATPAAVGTGATVVSAEGTPSPGEMPTEVWLTAQAQTTPTTSEATPTAVVAATTTPVPATSTPGTTSTQTTTYVVQWGDNLYSIARRCGTTVEAIVQMNNIADPNSIRVGQQLTLSCAGAPASTVEHIVKPGENLFRIALMYNTSVEAIAAANGIVNPSYIWVGQRLLIPQGTGTPPAETGRYHVVQPGETLYSIALRYGTTTAAIAVANDLSNPHLIYPGQTLLIPQ